MISHSFSYYSIAIIDLLYADYLIQRFILIEHEARTWQAKAYNMFSALWKWIVLPQMQALLVFPKYKDKACFQWQVLSKPQASTKFQIDEHVKIVL